MWIAGLRDFVLFEMLLLCEKRKFFYTSQKTLRIWDFSFLLSSTFFYEQILIIIYINAYIMNTPILCITFKFVN